MILIVYFEIISTTYIEKCAVRIFISKIYQYNKYKCVVVYLISKYINISRVTTATLA